jgi:hypothetical protein
MLLHHMHQCSTICHVDNDFDVKILAALLPLA